MASTVQGRAPKRALSVLEHVGDCWGVLRIVRLIQGLSGANVIASAAVREVSAAERFRRDLGSFRDEFDSDPRLQVIAKQWLKAHFSLHFRLIFSAGRGLKTDPRLWEGLLAGVHDSMSGLSGRWSSSSARFQRTAQNRNGPGVCE